MRNHVETHHRSIEHFIGIGCDVTGEAVPLYANADDSFNALDHHKAVVSATRLGPLLPAVFGSPLGASPAQLAIMMAQRSEALGHAVIATAELLEIGVRITWLRTVPEQSKMMGSGRSFLQAAAKKARAEAAFVDSVALLQDTFAQLVGVRAVRLLGVTAHVAKVALSAQRQQAAAISTRIESLASSMFELDVSGPWPLYSFGVDHVLGSEALS